MRLSEIVSEAWSSRGNSFPGTNQDFFTRRHYQFFANRLHEISDPGVREYLINWFADILAKDRAGFKPPQFIRAAEKGHLSDPHELKFQQRHFHYFAHFINKIDDPEIKEFLADWLGEVFKHSNPNFNMSRWKLFCGIETTPTEKKRANLRWPYMKQKAIERGEEVPDEDE